MATTAPTWGLSDGPDRDVVLTTRARLARNLAGFPFPGRCDEAELRRAANEVRRAARADSDRLADLSACEVATLPERTRQGLVDAQRISPELAAAGPERWALLDTGGQLSVLINEEDHVRVQAVVAGCAPVQALALAEDCAQRLERTLPFATSPERWGYLTASPGNLGTGLRLSVLVHLPALALVGWLDARLQAAFDLDIAIRGLHGESSASVADLYQISNAVSFGRTSRALADRVAGVAGYLVDAERQAREEARTNWSSRVQWRAHEAERALEADRIEVDAGLEALSQLRLAAALGLRAVPDDARFTRLVAEMRSTGGGDDFRRAARLRTALRRGA